jgi:hypothetical protein
MAVTLTPTNDLSTAIGSDPGLERLYDNVQLEVPAVTLAMVKVQAWNVIEEFYLRSTVERRDVYWQMGPGINTIDFNPFDESWLVAWVLHFDGIYNGKIDPPSILRDTTFPVANTNRNGQAYLVLRPISLDINFPVMLWVQWFDVLLAGVLSRLYLQLAKPFSSPQLGQLHGAQYRQGIKRARAYAESQYTDAPGRWRFPYFAHGKRKQ